MKYDAAGWWGRAVVQSAHITNSETKASRLARAMKAVLLAVRAWARAAARYAEAEQKGVLYCNGATFIFRRADAERRLYAAQERLERIEKEVSRG